MSNDCISGTPALIMVDSWRVKMAMSFCLIALPPLMRRFLTLVTRMPWRRRLALHHGLAAGAHFAADELAVLVLAFPLEDDVLDPTLCGYVPLP